jgi:hypothetical protein
MTTNPDECEHPSGTWQPWDHLEGVTSGIWVRIKTCDKCGKTVDSESKAS